jgi:hypothetical protein
VCGYRNKGPGETNPDLPDTDGDGLKDGDEWRAGTDPLNALSCFRIVVAGEIPTATLSLTWPSHTNAIYQVQTNPDLLTTNTWTTAADNIMGREGSTSLRLSVDFPKPAAYFRILLK